MSKNTVKNVKDAAATAIRFAIVTLVVFIIQPIVQADVNDTAIHAGAGRVHLILPNGNTYTPGERSRNR